MTDEIMPIGVFTSAGAGLGAGLEKVLELGVHTVQLHAPPAEGRTRENAVRIRERFADAEVEITLVFCGFPGESYASIPVVRDTVGLVPPAQRAERVQQAREIAEVASWLGAPGIGIHVGFIPEDWDSDDFADVVAVLGDLADFCADHDLCVNLETGQETADTLLHVLQTVDRENLGVNFDPANMILYGSGEPIEALYKVGKYVRSCHCKDAVWSSEPGSEWGEEVPLGHGDVDIERFVAVLNEFGYTGPLTIEREVSGDRQIEDIKAGIQLLRDIKGRLDIG